MNRPGFVQVREDDLGSAASHVVKSTWRTNRTVPFRILVDKQVEGRNEQKRAKGPRSFPT